MIPDTFQINSNLASGNGLCYNIVKSVPLDYIPYLVADGVFTNRF